MPAFDKTLCSRFSALRGGFSTVTRTEKKHDRAVTLTIKDNEQTIVEDYFGGRIHRGSSDSAAALQRFIRLDAAGREVAVDLKLVYPKPEKNELRLYFTEGLLDPDEGDVFFVFQRATGPLVVGSMAPSKWLVVKNVDPEDTDFQEDIERLQAGLPPRQIAGQYVAFSRSAATALQALKDADFKCEFSPDHPTFISAASDRPYVEAHHIIPISQSASFLTTLDVPSNIVALCPTCHRMIHHGLSRERRAMVEALVRGRPKLLAQFGVSMTDVLARNGLT